MHVFNLNFKTSKGLTKELLLDLDDLLYHFVHSLVKKGYSFIGVILTKCSNAREILKATSRPLKGGISGQVYGGKPSESCM